MTFGEHLEDLRRRILWALLWLTIAVVFSFIFGDTLLEWTMRPHKIAIRGAVRERAMKLMDRSVGELDDLVRGRGEGPFPAREDWEFLFASEAMDTGILAEVNPFLPEWAARLTPPGLGEPERKQYAARVESVLREFSEKLVEGIASGAAPVASLSLVRRLKKLEEDLWRDIPEISGTAVRNLLGTGPHITATIQRLKGINEFLVVRKKELLEDQRPAGILTGDTPFLRRMERIYDDLKKQSETILEKKAKPPIAISYLESFMTYLKVSMVFGLFFAIPMILYEMWKFVGAGLYANEQKYVLIFLPFSLALFFGGVLFGYFSVIPVALGFLAGWGAELVELNFTLSNYVGIFFTLTVVLGLVFQTPLVMIFLSKIGLVGAAGFRRARKYMILGSILFAALVTPPDPMSWSLVAGPTILLYEFGIIIVSMTTRKKAAKPRGPSQEEKQEVKSA